MLKKKKEFLNYTNLKEGTLQPLQSLDAFKKRCNPLSMKKDEALVLIRS